MKSPSGLAPPPPEPNSDPVGYPNPLSCASLCVADKPLPQGALGGIIGIVGGVIAAALILGVAVTVFIVYRRQQKDRTEADHDL